MIHFSYKLQLKLKWYSNKHAICLHLNAANGLLLGIDQSSSNIFSAVFADQGFLTFIPQWFGPVAKNPSQAEPHWLESPLWHGPVKHHTAKPQSLESQYNMVQCNTILHTRDHSGYGFGQWEPTLQSNVGSHWLSPYPEWSLYSTGRTQIELCTH